MIKKAINIILKKYVWCEERVKKYINNYIIPYEKEVILIDTKENITKSYYLIIIYYNILKVLRRYNIFIGNTDYKINLLINLRDNVTNYKYRLFKNVSPLIAIKEIRDDALKIKSVKRPIFNISIKINDDILDFNIKRIIMSYHYEDLICDVLKIYGYETINRLLVKKGLKIKEWSQEDLSIIRIKDIVDI